jgi:Na+/H+ antiporter NhaD/arsenite permease-like protein
MTWTSGAALAILILTYGGVAIGRIPGLRLDRAGIAFLGGAAMIAVGALSLEEAYRAIDFDTITLLLGMMIVVAHLKVSGAFRPLGAIAVEHAHAPFALLATVTILTGVMSAFLVNDAICLVMGPIVVHIARALKRNPLPYLVATATASNCGSVATITGNPQNMVIGALSGVSYPAFSAALAPVAAFGLIAVIAVVRFIYAEEFERRTALRPQLVRGAPASGPGRQGLSRLHRARDRVLRRRPTRQSRALGRRLSSGDARHQTGANLSRDRRAVADPVYRPLRGCGGSGARAADAPANCSSQRSRA